MILLAGLTFATSADNEGPFYYFGYWMWSVFITFGGAGIVIALGCLFLTSWLKGKAIPAFVMCAWAMGVLVVTLVSLPG